MTNTKIFKQVVKKLDNEKVPSKVNLEKDGEICIVLGRDFPDSLAHKVFEIMDDICGDDHKFSVCGDSIYNVAVEYTYGGPKSW